MTRLLITGAGGFIGSHAARYFSSLGWEVRALVRRIPDAPLPNVSYSLYDLTQPLDETPLRDGDFLLHCAYVPNDIRANTEGSRRLLDAARKFGFKKCVAISSFSASERAPSKYGRQKFEIEKMFGDCLSPGIVLGNGGLFRRMSDHVKGGKPIPLVDGGRQPVQFILIDDLLAALRKVFESDLKGKFLVAYPKAVSYKEFCASLGARPKFVTVPFHALELASEMAEALRLPLPVGRDNILGLKHLRSMDTGKDLKRLGLEPRSLAECLRAIDSATRFG
jgi:nucleoside-diphosphate-sugar epimerase